MPLVGFTARRRRGLSLFRPHRCHVDPVGGVERAYARLRHVPGARAKPECFLVRALALAHRATRAIARSPAPLDASGPPTLSALSPAVHGLRDAHGVVDSWRSM